MPKIATTKTQKAGELKPKVKAQPKQQPVVETEVTESQLPLTETMVTESAVTLEGGAKKKKVNNKRTFKIKLNDSEFCSRITGNTPKQAASKALTLLINQKKNTGKSVKGKIVFTIKETTRGSKGKEYSYQGEKIKLKTPTTYKIKSSNGEIKEIINKFKNVIEKYQQ
jgi:hypothetical protein